MTDIIPIFPLNAVLLPRMPLPLHIFEQRYKQMLADCEQHNRSFGVVPVLDQRMCAMGCAAEIERVVQRYADGRADILTFGTERFSIGRVNHDKPYLQAEVRYFRDAAPEDPVEIERLGAHARELLLQFAETQGQQLNENALGRVGLEDLSFLLASNEVFNHREKRLFLETRSTAERLRCAVPVLERGIARRRSRRQLRRFFGESRDLDNLSN